MVVVHLWKRDHCERCGLRPSPERVIVFTDSLGMYLDLPLGHIQCVMPA